MAAATAFLVGSAIAGIGMQAYGQIKGGRAAQTAANAAAEREEFNAGLADQAAGDARARGAEEAGRFRAGVRSLIGSQRAGFAGQGVKVGQGSARDVTADAAHLGELDARQIVANAEREAWGFEMEAKDRRMGADVARRGGQAAASAGRWGAAGTVLGGANMLVSRYGWPSGGGGSTPLPSGRIAMSPSLAPGLA
jgi:hypothetical protein